MGELSEAKRIVGALAALGDDLRMPDRRFVAGWTEYLAREGEAARIGPNRLEYLRRTWRDYFPEAAPLAPGVAPLAASVSGQGIA